MYIYEDLCAYLKYKKGNYQTLGFGCRPRSKRNWDPLEAVFIYHGELDIGKYVLRFKDVKLLKSGGFFSPLPFLSLTEALET